MLWALIRKELIALSRDVHGLAALFVLPVIFILLMSMALKDVYSPHVDHLKWAVLDHEQNRVSQDFIHRWQQDSGSAQALPADWQAALKTGQLKYVLEIKAGAADQLAQHELEHDRAKQTTATSLASPSAQANIVLHAEPSIDFGIFTMLRAQLQAMVTALRVETMLTALPLPPEAKIDASHFTDVGAYAKAERINAGPRPTSVQHNVPAWLVFGMFFVVTTIAGLFVEERQCGSLSRLRSMGVSPLLLLLAKVLPFMLINCLQAALMLAVGVYVMPLLGGDALSLIGINWPALLLMLASISVAAISLALLVATLVKSQAQASAIGPMMNILMAALGGIMVPTFVMPTVMQTLSQYSPMNWALEGLLDVLLRGGGMGQIQHEVSYLCLLALTALSLAYLRFKTVTTA